MRNSFLKRGLEQSLRGYKIQKRNNELNNKQEEITHAKSASQYWYQQDKALRISSAYKAIILKCQELDWPQLWVTDVVDFDRRFCLENQDKPFLWQVRSTGTDIYHPNNKQDLLWLRASMSSGQERRYFWWDGYTLEEVTPKGALDYL